LDWSIRLSVTSGVVGTLTTVENRFAAFACPLGPVKKSPPFGGRTVLTDLLTCCSAIVVSAIVLSTFCVNEAGGAPLLLPSEKPVCPLNLMAVPAVGALKMRKNSREAPADNWPMVQVTDAVGAVVGSAQFGLAVPTSTNAA
jgi:hypothetical protein